MFKSIEGIVREGKIELLEEVPTDVSGKVIITFLSTGSEETTSLDTPTPIRREEELLVYDGHLTGNVEATIEAVREERIRNCAPELNQ
jgi:hypothetical protein